MISEESQNPQKTNQSQLKKPHFQIDLLKTIAILFVIVDHSVPYNLLHPLGNTLWERTSIPIFLIIMGINIRMSFNSKNDQEFTHVFNYKYFLKKIARYFIPFIIAWIFSTILGVLIFYNGDLSLMISSRFGEAQMWEKSMMWMGMLVFYGPGNWFIIMLFQSIILIPPLLMIYHKNPKMTFLFSILFEALVQISLYLVIGSSLTIGSTIEYYIWWHSRSYIDTSFIRYLFPITLGFWFSDNFSIGEKSTITNNGELIDKRKILEKFPFLNRNPVKLGTIILISLTILFIIVSTLTSHFVSNLGIYLLIYFILSSIILGFIHYSNRYDYFMKYLPIYLLIILIELILFILQLKYINVNSSLTIKLLLYTIVFILYISPIVIQFVFFKAIHNWFIWPMALMSSIYIVFYHFYSMRIEFLFGDYQLFVYPHSALFILLIIRWIPQNPKNLFAKLISKIGRATYHILFTQMILFAYMENRFGTSYFENDLSNYFTQSSSNPLYDIYYTVIYLVLCWIFSITLGVFWFSIEDVIKKKIKSKNIAKIPTSRIE